MILENLAVSLRVLCSDLKLRILDKKEIFGYIFLLLASSEVILQNTRICAEHYPDRCYLGRNTFKCLLEKLSTTKTDEYT